MTIEILGRRNSMNVQKVMWTLGELGLDYVRHDVAGSFGFPDDYESINPNMLVPTLRDGTLTLWESNACVRYLARTYGQGTLWPDDPAMLARADQWMDWAKGELYRYFIEAFWHRVRLTGDRCQPAKIERGIERAGHYYQMLDRRLSNTPYVAGDQFTMGDIPLGTMSYRYFEVDFQRPELPNVRDWYERIRARPAYQKHAAIWCGRNATEWDEQEQKNAGVQ